MKICSKLTIKTLEQHQWHHSSIFIVDFEHISHLVIAFLLLTLKDWDLNSKIEDAMIYGFWTKIRAFYFQISKESLQTWLYLVLRIMIWFLVNFTKIGWENVTGLIKHSNIKCFAAVLTETPFSWHLFFQIKSIHNPFKTCFRNSRGKIVKSSSIKIKPMILQQY